MTTHIFDNYRFKVTNVLSAGDDRAEARVLRGFNISNSHLSREITFIRVHQINHVITIFNIKKNFIVETNTRKCKFMSAAA